MTSPIRTNPQDIRDICIKQIESHKESVKEYSKLILYSFIADMFDVEFKEISYVDVKKKRDRCTPMRIQINFVYRGTIYKEILDRKQTLLFTEYVQLPLSDIINNHNKN